MGIIIKKMALCLCLIASFVSCNTSKKTINIEEVKHNYQDITLGEETFLARKSDIEKLSNLEVICSRPVENGIMPVRRILKRGLEPKYLLQYAAENFYFEYAFVVDLSGRTVLSKIVKSNVELSEDERLDLLIKILKTVVEKGKQDYECAIIITQAVTDS